MTAIVSTPSGRLHVTATGEQMRRLRDALGLRSARQIPPRAILAGARPALRRWATAVRVPAWLGEHRPAEVAQTQEMTP